MQTLVSREIEIEIEKEQVFNLVSLVGAGEGESQGRKTAVATEVAVAGEEGLSLTVVTKANPGVAFALQKARRGAVIVAAALSLALSNTVATFAQTTGVAAFTDASKKIIDVIKGVAGPAILLLIVAGFGLLMWGGVSENWKRRGISIIGCAIVGAALLFLFAEPLASVISTSFGTTVTTRP